MSTANITSTFDVASWLDETMSSGQRRGDRICQLYVANDGFEVIQWGIIDNVNGRQRGLDQEEALELLYISGFVHGLAAAGVPFFCAFPVYLRSWLAMEGLFPHDFKFLDEVGDWPPGLDFALGRLEHERACLARLESLDGDWPCKGAWIALTQKRIDILMTGLAKLEVENA